MILGVKLGTHKIGTYTYTINKCAFLLILLFGNAATKRSLMLIFAQNAELFSSEAIKICHSNRPHHLSHLTTGVEFFSTLRPEISTLKGNA